MARAPRVEFDGATYHVTSRGNERREVFRDDRDREGFLQAVGEMSGQFGVVPYGYCLMGNHYHLLLGTPRGNLSRAMQWLQTTYAARFNRRHRRCGHLFQGRFKAHLVEADTYAKQLVRYVHLNPVRPADKKKAVPPERREFFEGYRWSSHRAYAGTAAKGEVPDWLSLEWLAYWSDAAGLGGAGASGAAGPGSLARLRRAYRADLAGCFGEVVPDPLEGAKGGLVLGGEALWEKAKALLGGAGGASGRARRSAEAEGVLRWERRTGAEAVAARVRELSAGEEDKRLRVWLRVRLGGERLTEVARAEGYRDGSGVLHAVQRLEARAGGDRDLRRWLADLRRRFAAGQPD